MSGTVLLLPPSEGKNTGGSFKHSPDRFKSQLAKPRLEVLAALEALVTTAAPDVVAKRLKVRNDLFDRALVASSELIAGTAKQLPAWLRYSGVVWANLDPGTLSSDARRRILVPSAIYGLTNAEDMIADYRLMMNVPLPGLGTIASFWRPSLTELLRGLARRAQIVNLLPNEHAGAVGLRDIGHVVDVGFVQRDGQRAAGHFAKAAKGRFARHVIDHGIGAATEFSMPGWKVSESGTGYLVVAST